MFWRSRWYEKVHGKLLQWWRVYHFGIIPEVDQMFWKLRNGKCHSELLQISQFFAIIFRNADLEQVFSWCKPSGKMRGTCCVLGHSGNSHSCNVISEGFLVQISVLRWRAVYNYLKKKQRSMDGHLRKLTRELVPYYALYVSCVQNLIILIF